MLVTASLHAVRRARERLGWNRRALERMLDRIYHLGDTAERAAGPLRAHLAQLQSPSQSHVVRYFAGHVFVFARDLAGAATLVTLYRLHPGSPHARSPRRDRREEPRAGWARNRPSECTTAQPGRG